MGEGGGGEVVDITHNCFWLHDGGNYKSFSKFQFWATDIDR
jgi:hypothetical protein